MLLNHIVCLQYWASTLTSQEDEKKGAEKETIWPVSSLWHAFPNVSSSFKPTEIEIDERQIVKRHDHHLQYTELVKMRSLADSVCLASLALERMFLVLETVVVVRRLARRRGMLLDVTTRSGQVSTSSQTRQSWGNLLRMFL